MTKSSHQDVGTEGLIELMNMFPSDARFFINTWTWGYEDILKAVSHSFGAKVKEPLPTKVEPSIDNF